MQEKKADQDKLKYDILTELPDHSFLYARLQEAIDGGQRENRLVALLIMGLEPFKEINQTLGYHIGDLLLRQVGLRVRDLLRDSDSIARLRGVEFGVLLPSISGIEDVTSVALRILKALEQPFVLGALKLGVQASIGIALFPEHTTNADLLIQRANIALSLASKTHSGYAIYSADQDQSNPRSLALIGELRRAIVEDRLFLVYQPKIDLRTGLVTGVETLVRWQHPQLGTILPDQFIPLAEQTGLIMPLTLWVLHEALEQCRFLNETGLEIKMAANLSMWNLQAQEFPDQVTGLLETCGVSPFHLEFEITESAIMANPARTMENLTRMSKMDLRFAIDDFGTGYSSLAYLKKLPVREIKIDKSFVTNMTADKDDAIIVRSIIDLGHNLGLKVAAEGVENQETKKMLAALNCDAAQGFFICKPLPAAELTAWLRKFYVQGVKLRQLPRKVK
ncbi:MAG: putative bifunctional diguanylate cyclase/phosphodiesterase [Candidatus Binatia bacterium]